MIKQTFVLSLLLISVPAIASTPCPTCKKSYVASSLEEALIAQQEVKKSVLKKISFDKPFSDGKAGKTLPAKSPTAIIMNQDKRNNRDNQTGSTYGMEGSLAPKTRSFKILKLIFVIKEQSAPAFTHWLYYLAHSKNYLVKGIWYCLSSRTQINLQLELSQGSRLVICGTMRWWHTGLSLRKKLCGLSYQSMSQCKRHFYPNCAHQACFTLAAKLSMYSY